MPNAHLSRLERIRRAVKRGGIGLAAVSIVAWLSPFGRGWSEALLASALIGVAAAWSAASGGRFDADAGSDWGDVDSGDGDGGDSGGGGDGGD